MGVLRDQMTKTCDLAMFPQFHEVERLMGVLIKTPGYRTLPKQEKQEPVPSVRLTLKSYPSPPYPKKRKHAGRIYAKPIPFSIYNFSNINILMIAMGYSKVLNRMRSTSYK